jgi:hypothetical protein
VRDLDPPPRPRTREARERTAERKKLAEKLGVSIRTIQRAEMRDAERTVTIELDTIGMTVDETFLNHVGRVDQYFRKASYALRTAQQELSRLANSKLDFPTRRLEYLREKAHELTNMILDTRPTSLCPYCKGLPGLLEHCAVCLTVGYVGDLVRSVCKKELLDSSAPIVMANGKETSVDDYLSRQELFP